MARGFYRKQHARAEADAQPCAWELGDARSFAAARSRCLEGIVLDRNLSGAEHRALCLCLRHMNAGERWSCFISIPKLAKETGCSKATCWRALHDADGTHILTRRGTRSSAHGRHDVTFVTIHPRYKLSNLRPSETERGSKLSNLSGQGLKIETTRSQKCEENFLQGTSINKPPDQSYYWKHLEEKERRRSESSRALSAIRESAHRGMSEQERVTNVSSGSS
jgi:hypothetical protein